MKPPISISQLQNTDLDKFKQLIILFNDVFEEYHSIASNSHLENLLQNPEFYAVVVEENNTIIGGLTAYEMKRYYSDSSELYIYDMAVKTNQQNNGIGKRLIKYLKSFAAQNNIETIFVEAHSEDKQAVKFYESSIGQSEKVDHFNLDVKKA